MQFSRAVDLGGEVEQRERHGEPKRLGGLEIDDQLRFGLMDGRSGSCPFEY
jgi:hypothetical protein